MTHERALLAGFCVTLLYSISPALAGTNGMRTTVTTYDYNVDGALTAITVQVDQETPTKRYLTWDVFTPDADDPSTGTVSQGDGRLMGIGPAPGIDSATSTFGFDPRDRLTAYGGTNGSETYDYHANGMLSSSSTAGDDLFFYYDTGQHPRATNLHQSATDLWSAYLGRNRYLNDGSEEALLRPRKDTACTYDTAQETLRSYAYDAFGGTDEDPAAEYDLGDNSFRYGGEYRDPFWGGYYLRGRWYHPDLPTFITRDPDKHLNRYGYAGGNPVMSVDPSGYSAKWYRGIEHALQGAVKKLNSGVGGHFARIFLAPILGPLQILAYPDQFWHSLKTDRDGIDVFLALGVATEFAGGFADSYFAGFAVSLGKRFAARAAADLTIGIGSSIAAGADRGFNHFNWKSFGEGLELSAGAVVTRGLTGAGVRSSFQLSSGDVAELSEYLKDAPDNTALVFRQKVKLPSLVVAGKNVAVSPDTPLQQAFNVGVYHERLIAITKDEIMMNDSVVEGIRISATEHDDFASILKQVKKFKGKFEFVGRVEDFSASNVGRRAFFSNPYNNPVLVNETELDSAALRSSTYKVYEYGQFTNNCQHHAYGVLKQMGLR